MNPMRRAATSIPEEIEAKLLVPSAAVLDAIAEIEQLGAHRLRARGTARLHSVYLDTRDMTLAQQGVALRLRRRGRRWEATVKWSGRVRGTVHQRPELTVPLPRAPHLPCAVPAGLRPQLGALLGRRRLVPILVTRIERRLFDVLAHETDITQSESTVIAELALDRVRLMAPERPRRALATYREVEIEARRGTPRDIRSLTALLQERFDLTPSRDSKFARGLALLYGRPVSR